MKTTPMLRRMRQMKTWAARLTLAGLLCLEGWFAYHAVCEWPGRGTAASTQPYTVDLAYLFSTR